LANRLLTFKKKFIINCLTIFFKLFIISISCLKLTENIIRLLIILTKDQQLEVRLQFVNILYDCTVIFYDNLTNVEANKLVAQFLIPALCNLSQDSDVKCRLEVLTVLAKLGKLISSEV